MCLYDHSGKRKYLTIAERRAFLEAARREAPPKVQTFCSVLAHTGARISEVLDLISARVEFEPPVIVIKSLKKRRHGVYRAVPVPQSLCDELEAVHHVGSLQNANDRGTERLWSWGRTTAWAVVTDMMRKAGIRGPQATPKGLRHGFAVAALQSGVPLNVVSKWLGHSRLSTTAIYANAMGEEERLIAERFWNTF